MRKLFLYWLPVLAILHVSVQQLSAQSFSKAPVATHKNPVLDIDFPDPTVINVNGTYYAYATQSFHAGKTINIQVASSRDMFTWKYEGDALPNKPVWANQTQDFWAPHVLYDSAMKKYVMFFCAESNDTATDKCIGVAFSDNPTGPFTDKGSPLVTGKGFVNIDPMAMIDSATGKKIMYWGSGFAPIKVQELSNDWTSFKEGSSATAVVYPGKEKNYTNLVEGGWIDIYEGNYYLYYSGDNCCGKGANYAVMVAKANNAFGPFVRLGESNAGNSSVILEKDSSWIAPGHNSIFTDNKGNRYIAYHAIKKETGKADGSKNMKRVMCIEPLVYQNGWPFVIHRY